MGALDGHQASESPLRYLIGSLMVVVGVLLALAAAYLVRGSLEMFPTAEQQENVRIVSGTAVLVFAGFEIMLWRLLRASPRRAV